MGRGGYEEVVAATSIIRPAARSAIVTYLERLHTGMWERLDHRYENALAETRGVLVYQEDVAKAATAVAGFGAAEADRLRRIVCLKEPVSTLEEYRIRFHTGAARRGFDSLTTTSVWRMIEEFSGYSFCKAHSASYALVAFRLAWMKVHFPEVFFPSVINNGGGYYRRQFYLDEARRSGLGILRPDVTVSRGRYVAEGSGMRVGLTQIAGVTEHLASRIVRERGRSRFVDVEDFIGRVVPADAALRNLVHAGALDSLSSGTRRRIRWQCFAIGAQRSLFADSPVLLDVEHSAKTLVRHEVESTGLFISDHPIEMLRPAIDLWRRRNAIEVVEPIQRLVAHKAGWRKPAPPEPGVTLVGCPVAIKEVAMRSGEVMCFASFEDETGVVETVLSPAVYRTSRRVLLRGYIIAIRGEVSYEWQTPMITVRELDLIV